MGYHISPCVVDHDTGCNVGQYGFMKTVILHRYPLHLRKTLGNAVERAVYLRIGRFRETQRRVAGPISDRCSQSVFFHFVVQSLPGYAELSRRCRLNTAVIGKRFLDHTPFHLVERHT